jgi:phosphinothricin acetyltransferase
MASHIRLATAADVPAILAISNEAAVTSVANLANEPEALTAWQALFTATNATHPWLVAANDEGNVLGFAKASPWNSRDAFDATVEVAVYVKPHHHRRGIGHSLYTRLLEILKQQGYHAVLAGITLPNDTSVHFHESFGLQPVAMFKQVGWKGGSWHDVGYWQMQLQHGTGDGPRLRPVVDVI